MSHVTRSTSKEYVGPWNKCVKWSGELRSGRCPLPASDFTVALFLQSVADGVKTFAPVKSHSAAIAFFLFNHLPTQSPAVRMVRQAAIRKLCLSPRNRKVPFKWADAVIYVRHCV